MQWNLMVERKKKKISQQDLAKILNISKDSYGKKERGETQFTLDEVFMLSVFFGKTVEEIFLPRNCINNAIN